MPTMCAAHVNGRYRDSDRYRHGHGKPNGYGPAAGDTDAQTSSHTADNTSCAICRLGNIWCSGYSLHP